MVCLSGHLFVALGSYKVDEEHYKIIITAVAFYSNLIDTRQKSSQQLQKGYHRIFNKRYRH
jgi:hypothetical protein